MPPTSASRRQSGLNRGTPRFVPTSRPMKLTYTRPPPPDPPTPPSIVLSSVESLPNEEDFDFGDLGSKDSIRTRGAPRPPLPKQSDLLTTTTGASRKSESGRKSSNGYQQSDLMKRLAHSTKKPPPQPSTPPIPKNVMATFDPYMSDMSIRSHNFPSPHPNTPFENDYTVAKKARKVERSKGAVPRFDLEEEESLGRDEAADIAFEEGGDYDGSQEFEEGRDDGEKTGDEEMGDGPSYHHHDKPNYAIDDGDDGDDDDDDEYDDEDGDNNGDKHGDEVVITTKAKAVKRKKARNSVDGVVDMCESSEKEQEDVNGAEYCDHNEVLIKPGPKGWKPDPLRGLGFGPDWRDKRGSPQPTPNRRDSLNPTPNMRGSLQVPLSPNRKDRLQFSDGSATVGGAPVKPDGVKEDDFAPDSESSEEEEVSFRVSSTTGAARAPPPKSSNAWKKGKKRALPYTEVEVQVMRDVAAGWGMQFDQGRTDQFCETIFSYRVARGVKTKMRSLVKEENIKIRVPCQLLLESDIERFDEVLKESKLRFVRYMAGEMDFANSLIEVERDEHGMAKELTVADTEYCMIKEAVESCAAEAVAALPKDDLFEPLSRFVEGVVEEVGGEMQNMGECLWAYKKVYDEHQNLIKKRDLRRSSVLEQQSKVQKREEKVRERKREKREVEEILKMSKRARSGVDLMRQGLQGLT